MMTNRGSWKLTYQLYIGPLVRKYLLIFWRSDSMGNAKSNNKIQYVLCPPAWSARPAPGNIFTIFRVIDENDCGQQACKAYREQGSVIIIYLIYLFPRSQCEQRSLPARIPSDKPTHKLLITISSGTSLCSCVHSSVFKATLRALKNAKDSPVVCLRQRFHCRS